MVYGKQAKSCLFNQAHEKQPLGFGACVLGPRDVHAC